MEKHSQYLDKYKKSLQDTDKFVNYDKIGQSRRKLRKNKNEKTSNNWRFAEKAAYFRVNYKGKKRSSDALLLLMYLTSMFDVNLDSILSKSRKHPLPYVRQLFSYFADNYLDMPHREIADLINRERSTMVTNVQLVSDLIDVYPLALIDAQKIDTFLSNLLKRRNRNEN